MRVLQSYDKISFKNNIVTEEFVITMMREESLEDINEGVNNQNESINERVNDSDEKNERVNTQNERVKDVFERVNTQNERVKNELVQLYSVIEQNPLVKIETIEKFNKKSNATNRRYLKILKNNGLIEYVGSDKTGGYRIIQKK